MKKKLYLLSLNFTTSTMSDLPVRWKDNASIYPDPQEIARCLQEPGVASTRKRNKKDVPCTKFPLIDKLAVKIYKSIQEQYNPEGLTKNVTRGKERLVQGLVLHRRHADVSHVNTFFHQFQVDGKVYVITDNVNNSGIDVPIDRFQSEVEMELKRKNSARTCNDGLRLASIMLDPKYRAIVAPLMTNRRDKRAHSDIPGDPCLHFFEKALVESFADETYVVYPPDESYYDMFPEDEKAAWDPNSPDLFSSERTPIWLKETWDNYLRPKYKEALRRWNKDTGGGSGEATDFIDYCGSDRWLVWVFCVDLEANFLLANNAGGAMPRHLQLEQGVDGYDSIDGDAFGAAYNAVEAASRKRKAAEDELKERLESKARVDNMMNIVVSHFGDMKHQKDKKKSNMEKADELIQKVARYQQLIDQTKSDSDMSPVSKSAFIEVLNGQRKDRMNELQKLRLQLAATEEDEGSEVASAITYQS